MKEILICDKGKCGEAAELCKKYGLAVNADSFSDPEHLAAHPGAIEEHLKTYADIKIQSMHGPYRDLCLGSKDSLIKAATMTRFEYAYALSKKLECRHIIMHHGYIPATSYPPNWTLRAKAFFDAFFRSKDNETTIYLENQLELSPDLISAVVGAADDKRLRICLDVGHANCNSNTPVLKWIDQLRDQIGFVHLHNNNGKDDQHLDCASGSMDMRTVCDALETHAPNATWCIEARTMNDVEESISWLIRNNYM